jgi:hypothetical protein
MKYGLILASFGLIGVVDPADGLSAELLKVGALGAVVLFLLWKDRDRQEKADEQWRKTNEQLFSYLERNTQAHVQSADSIRDLTVEMRNRPCLKEREK